MTALSRFPRFFVTSTSPCPYLPAFGGNVRTEQIADIWTSSPLFKEIRKRDELGGRCGSCELAFPRNRVMDEETPSPDNRIIP